MTENAIKLLNYIFDTLWEMNTLSREETVKIVLVPSEKGPTLKGKNLLPSGANSFLLKQTLFQK